MIILEALLFVIMSGVFGIAAAALVRAFYSEESFFEKIPGAVNCHVFFMRDGDVVFEGYVDEVREHVSKRRARIYRWRDHGIRVSAEIYDYDSIRIEQ